jgi:hypothetical protein
MAKRKRRKVNLKKVVRAGGTGFTGKRPKDKPAKIGKGGFAAGVGEKAVKV